MASIHLNDNQILAFTFIPNNKTDLDLIVAISQALPNHKEIHNIWQLFANADQNNIPLSEPINFSLDELTTIIHAIFSLYRDAYIDALPTISSFSIPFSYEPNTIEAKPEQQQKKKELEAVMNMIKDQLSKINMPRLELSNTPAMQRLQKKYSFSPLSIALMYAGKFSDKKGKGETIAKMLEKLQNNNKQPVETILDTLIKHPRLTYHRHTQLLGSKTTETEELLFNLLKETITPTNSATLSPNVM